MTFATLVATIALLYFVPALIAAVRHKRSTGAIFALNLFLGWSVLGWLGALIWALTADAPAAPTAIPAELSLGARAARRWPW